MTTPPEYGSAVPAAAPIVRSRECARCGCVIESHDPFCPGCGGRQPTEQAALAASPAASLAASLAAAPASAHLRCNSCGAEVAVDLDHRSYTCAFCGSNYVVDFTPEQTGRQRPEFVLGFAVTPEQALARFRQWLGAGGWFRPRDLASAQVGQQVRGVYLPFWMFSMLARSRWAATIGEYWYRTETYTTTENGKTVTRTRTVTETEWWPLAGGFEQYHSGYLVSGSRGLPQRFADRIAPYHLAGLRRYAPEFLAGWLCEEYSIDRHAALPACQAEFARRQEQAVAAFLPGDTQRGLQVQTQFEQVGSDLVLLPVYLWSYPYRGKLYRFVLNGQTGQAAGERPISPTKVGLVVAAVFAALLTILAVLSMQ